ncbi:intercellular adhesion molecule 4-like [Stigmatopora nigra]
MELRSLLSIFLTFFSLSGFWGNFYVLACVKCADNPVFTPAKLFVEFGSSATATCAVCRQACQNRKFGLEKSIGREQRHGTTIVWTVDKMDDWPLPPLCYYNGPNRTQCCSTLHVTVYKYPEKVSLLLDYNGEAMVEGNQYTARCYVENVAPVKLLNVKFYQGSNELRHERLYKDTRKKPATVTYNFQFNATKEMDGSIFWCEGQLDLENKTMTTSSGSTTAIVFYKPQFLGNSNETINLMVGDPLHLNCSTEGNPIPLVTWNTSAAAITTFEGEILSVDSVTTANEGQYTCYIANRVGGITVEFNVTVQVNYNIIILGSLAALAALAILAVALVYVFYYRITRTGEYNTKDPNRSGTKHVALPDQDL